MGFSNIIESLHTLIDAGIVYALFQIGKALVKTDLLQDLKRAYDDDQRIDFDEIAEIVDEHGDSIPLLEAVKSKIGKSNPK